MKPKWLVFVAGTCLVLSGCVGNRFNASRSSELVPGVTSFEDAQRILDGKPTSEVVLPDGRRSYVWMHSDVFGRVQVLSLTFTAEGKLAKAKGG